MKSCGLICINSAGMVTMPKEIRKKLNVNNIKELEIFSENGTLVLKPVLNTNNEIIYKKVQ